MAQGDTGLWHKFLENLGDNVHNLSSNDIYFGLVTATTTPNKTDSDPRWAGTGTPDYSANQINTTGGYTGPINLSTTITDNWSISAAVAKFDIDDVSITQNGSSANNARWGIVYDNTATNKNCIGWLDLGAVVDLTAGDFTVTWNAGGLFDITNPTA